jgi:simple sugar transport system permease protein
VLNRLKDLGVFQFLLCVLVPIGIYSLLIISEGKTLESAYSTILNATFGSAYGFGEVVVRAMYLILTSIAAILPVRVGLANAGGEGQMAIGALGTAVLGSTVLYRVIGPVGIPLLIVCGMLCGAFWSSLGIFCKMKLNMNEILTTILLNYIATYVVSMLLFGVLRDPHGWNYPQTIEIGKQLRLPSYFGTRMHSGIFIAVSVVLIVWFILNKTQTGFLMRTIGGNTRAAYYAGIKVKKTQTLVFIIAGAIAGLAGALLIIGVEGRMRIGAGETMGFMGFLTAGMVNNNVIWTIPSAFLIAILNVAGNSLEINTGLPASSIQILIMLILLMIMVVGRRKKL